MQTFLVGLCLFHVVFGLDNGLGRTPAMGYNTWDDFRCDNISAINVMRAADGIVRQGLDKLGYVYVNIDDCWAVGRDNKTGVLIPDPKFFPNGMKPVGDYLHSLGLKFGTYTDRGTLTCAGRPGAQGYEVLDAQTYASWGVDYLKEDSCYADSDDHEVAFAQYALMRDALNATGRPIYFSLCGWHGWYSPVGMSLGNSWRMADDSGYWGAVLTAMDTNSRLGPYAGPGGWNDPDILIGTSEKTAIHLTQDQSRSMFSLWCIMAAPLLIGSNVYDLNAFDLETFSNRELIAVNQDPLGFQGIRLFGGNLNTEHNPSVINIWGKLLSDGGWAVFFFNNGDTTKDMTCDSKCLSEMGFQPTDIIKARDLWLHQDIGTFSGSFTVSSVPLQGGSATYKFVKQ